MVTSYQSALGGRITPTVPKPKFLEHLEEFLQKELRLLGCPSSGPCELRVQVSTYAHVCVYVCDICT